MHDIYFSVVREDPSVELAIVDKINIPNCNILTIASGGCTAFSLLTRTNNITLIDMHIGQLYLCELKLGVIRYFKDSDKILDFFEGNNVDVNLMNLLVHSNYISQVCYDYWMADQSSLIFGINRIGKYELLFRELIESDYDFATVFSKANLSSKFGQIAVAATHDFVDKFRQIYAKYKADNTNYFYHHIIHDKYDRQHLPPYLHDKLQYDGNIRFIHNNMVTYLENTTIGTYDLINLSNITDWMDIAAIDRLFQLVSRALTKNGYVIIRRLASQHDIQKMASQYFKIVDTNAYPIDKSHFNEVIVGSTKITVH